MARDGRSDGLLRRLVRRWRNWRAARAGVAALASSGREADNIARDVGLSTAELYAVARAPADAAEQLKQRLQALHLDQAALRRNEPSLRDLERTCTVCGAKRRCERDLARNADDPVWQSYCPNAPALQALQEETKRRGP
jgi:hypothetical protein